MIVVSDSSVLINLAGLQKLDLLNALYGQLIVPESVWEEVVTRGHGKLGTSAIQAAEWIEVRSVKNLALVHSLRQDLDAGEAEAIAVAVETEADLLLIDERLGRATAHYFGLRYVGLVGVLIAAKRRGLIATVKPDLDRLRNEIGFYLSDTLYQRVLSDENEI